MNWPTLQQPSTRAISFRFSLGLDQFPFLKACLVPCGQAIWQTCVKGSLQHLAAASAEPQNL